MKKLLKFHNFSFIQGHNFLRRNFRNWSYWKLNRLCRDRETCFYAHGHQLLPVQFGSLWSAVFDDGWVKFNDVFMSFSANPFWELYFYLKGFLKAFRKLLGRCSENFLPNYVYSIFSNDENPKECKKTSKFFQLQFSQIKKLFSNNWD